VDLKTKQIAPIGTKARHLNRVYAYDSGSENQLSYWTKLGYLAGMTDEIHRPRNADWRDTHQAAPMPVPGVPGHQLRALPQPNGPGTTPRRWIYRSCKRRSLPRRLQAAGCGGVVPEITFLISFRGNRRTRSCRSVCDRVSLAS